MPKPARKPKYLSDKDPWILAEEIPDIDFHFAQIWLSSFANDLERTVGRNYRKVLCVHRGYGLKFYYGERDSDAFAKHVLGKILKNPKFGDRINGQIRAHSKKLKQLSRTLEPERLKKMSNAQLAQLLRTLDAVHSELYTWGWLPNAVDMFHGNFTGYLKTELGKRLPKAEVNSALVALTATKEKSVLQQEHESFLGIVALKQRRAPAAAYERALEKHLEKYFYFKYLWLGKEGVYTRGYYDAEVKKFMKSGESASELLKKENAALSGALKERSQLLKKLKLPKNVAHSFNVYAEFAVTKLFRRDAQIYWSYRMGGLFHELSIRLKVPAMDLRFSLPGELQGYLQAGVLSTAEKQLLRQRTKYCAYYLEKRVDHVVLGKDAERLERSAKQKQVADVSELFGQTACLGKVTGTVRIVNDVADMRKMNRGDILVSIATNPDVVPAMKLAGAIVTEQGGITSHAAIVSRELGTPCVIGTKVATKVLRDGDTVEVDANEGVVRVVKRAGK